MALNERDIVLALRPERASELIETLDDVLDTLIESVNASSDRSPRLRLGIAFLMGLRDRIAEDGDGSLKFRS